MNWDYVYNPHVWPALFTLALVILLGGYSWSRRKIPGARLFTVGCLFGSLWIFGSVMAISSQNYIPWLFWIRFQTIWQLPAVATFTCFILDYAGLSRWLNLRNLILLAVPPAIVMVGIVFSNDPTLILSGWTLTGTGPLTQFNLLNSIAVGYVYLLALINIIILVRLAIQSPPHRWPAVIMLAGQILNRAVFLLVYLAGGVIGQGEYILAAIGSMFFMYALALFRFQVFSPVPLARSAVIDQMGHGMLVLDRDNRIVDSNRTAVKILGLSAEKLIAAPVEKVLPVFRELAVMSGEGSERRTETALPNRESGRYLSLSLTALKDRRGQLLGHLLLLHDITEQKAARNRIQEQQQVMATLRERERLARELHDSTSQVLGFISLQGKAIHRRIQSGQIEKAVLLLDQLVEVARDAHADVRESILSLKSASGREWDFLPILKNHLAVFQTHYGISVNLNIDPDFTRCSLYKEVEVQLLRVIQEALTNIRKHSTARQVQISIQTLQHRISIGIQDDGCGFSPDLTEAPNQEHFGLVIMRERMEQIGGSIEIQSGPEAGTLVKLEAPLRPPEEQAHASITGG